MAKIEGSLELMHRLSSDEGKLNDVKKFIYKRYRDIALLSNGSNNVEDVILENKYCFRVMGSSAVFTWVLSDSARRSNFFKAELKETPELAALFESVYNLKAGLNKLYELVGSPVTGVNSIEHISKAMLVYVEPDIVKDVKDDYFADDEDGYFADDEDSGLDDLDDKLDDDYFEDDDEPEIEEQDNTEQDRDEPDYSGLEPEVIANTSRVMNVYRDLFEVGFELQVPYGILTKEGAIRLSNSGSTIVDSTPSLANIYELLNVITNRYLIQSQISDGVKSDKLRNIDMRKGTTYYPEFQLGNLYGILRGKKVDSWEELGKELNAEIKNNIKNNIREGRDIASIVDALTTCIVISEFKPDVALKLRINIGNRLANPIAIEREYSKRRGDIFAGTGELFHIDVLGSGVIEVILVFNKAAYNGRPLFAYEAVLDQQKRGRIPRTKEMILGQDTSGKIMTTNLDRQNASILLIGAGQRSGKGVLTLNLLGTVLADGHPLIYVDGKPDMAPVLWNVGRKNGLNPAVWDAFDSNGNILGSGAPEGIVRDNFDIFGLLAYLKVLQLMMISAHLRASKGVYVGGENKRPFFIFDEALAVQQALSGAWHGIIGMAKDKKDESEEAQWCRTVVNWAEKLSNNLASTINSQLPKSGMSTVWLFQAIQPTTWNQYKTEGMYKPFAILSHPLMSRMSIKLLGRGTADSEYGLSKVAAERVVAERVLSDSGRHFAYTESQKINDINTIKIFKPYLVLNTADSNSKEVNELRNNVSREVWDVIAPNGYLHEGAGFEGFSNMLGNQAIENLDLGRKMLEEVIDIIGLGGKYNSVDDLLYDASMESFISIGTLLSGGNVEQGGQGSTYYYVDEQEDNRDDNYNLDSGNIGEYTVDDLEILLGESNKSEEPDLDIRIDNKRDPIYNMMGDKGRRTILNDVNIKDFIDLNTTNSIDCREAGNGIHGLYESILINTPRGAQKYIDKLWDSVLRSIVRQGHKRANVTTVAMLGGSMFIGNKIVNLDGVLGGYEEIKLRDIASFKILFKKFFMIKDLILDEEMLRVAILEAGSIEDIFRMGRKLNRLIIQKTNGSAVVIDRLSLGVDGEDRNRIERQVKGKNEFDLYCANNRPTRWYDNIASQNIWGMRLAKKSFSGAGKLFFEKEKPKFGRALLLTGSGIVIGTVGAAAWGTARVLTGIYDLASGFRR